jgi:hypothetical protein
MEKHVQMITKTLEQTRENMTLGAEAISSTSRANIERADRFDLKNHNTKYFEPMRARDFDSMFKDPVALARPVSEAISVHMAGLQVLDASVSRFLTSLSVLQSVDEISRQRLEKTSNALKAINEAMGEILVEYRLHGCLTDEFVCVMERKLLAAMSGSSVTRGKQKVFNAFLMRE